MGPNILRLKNMNYFDLGLLKQLYRPAKDSHKGDNGKLLVIGGSELFHAAAFWAADVASRIVDVVHFSSPAMENNELVRIKKAKEKFWNGIVVPWGEVGDYIEEDDAVVIGPGMIRSRETKTIVDGLLKKFSSKKWVVDGGALQEMDRELLNEQMIVTPHQGEFKILFGEAGIEAMAKKYKCTILLKGLEDIVCNEHKCMKVSGGNEGMTKGGTGDVLAGLVGALYCKNDAFLAAVTGSYINKKAGDRLYGRVGPYFNATDLVNEIPLVRKFVEEGIIKARKPQKSFMDKLGEYKLKMSKSMGARDIDRVVYGV